MHARSWFCLLLMCCLFQLEAAAQLSFSFEKKEGGFAVFATNPDPFPVTAQVQWKLTNMRFSGGERAQAVVPASSQRFPLGSLEVVNARAGTQYSYRFQWVMGDVNAAVDHQFVYDLPFASNKTFRLHQGYQGRFSHQQENALDFTMDEGNEVRAAREGVVVQVVDQNSKSCPQPDCQQFNNHIVVMHADGSFARYAHIQLNGARVRLGAQVKKGDLLARSGNVGYSSGPHLHFVVFKAGVDKEESLATKFRVGDGTRVEALQEGMSYLKGY